MNFLFAAAMVSVFALALLIIGLSMEKNGKSFCANQRRGWAEVVGYRRAEESNWYTLLVRIPELNDGKFYSCSAGKINLSDYPKGTVVDVLYAPKRVVGMNIVEVHLLNNPPKDSIQLGRRIKVASIVMLVAAAALTVAGIVSIL